MYYFKLVVSEVTALNLGLLLLQKEQFSKETKEKEHQVADKGETMCHFECEEANQ